MAVNIKWGTLLSEGEVGGNTKHHKKKKNRPPRISGKHDEKGKKCSAETPRPGRKK